MKASKIMLSLAAIAMGLQAQATHYYISVDGVDDNAEGRGLSAEMPVKTFHGLRQVLDPANNFVDIHISGMLHMSDEVAAGTVADNNNSNFLYYTDYNEHKRVGIIVKNVAPWHYITITGADDESGIDGDGEYAFFYLEWPAKLEVNNLILQNGKACAEGGVINGVAQAKFTNCKFLNNKATNRAAVLFYGYSAAVNFTFEGCVFEGNEGGEGGVMHLSETSNKDTYGRKVTLKDCLFRNNKAKQGGALYIRPYYYECIVDIDGCSFVDNIASNDGGAIFIGNQINYVYPYDADRNENGSGNGNRNVALVDVNITNSYFNGNAANNGGAIYFNQNLTASASSDPALLVKFANCAIIGNGKQGCVGSAVNFNGGSPVSVIEFTNCTIAENVGNHGAIAHNKKEWGQNSPYLSKINYKNTIVTNNRLWENGKELQGPRTALDMTFSQADNNPDYSSMENFTFSNSYVRTMYYLSHKNWTCDNFNFESSTEIGKYNLTNNTNVLAPAHTDLTYKGMPWGAAALHPEYVAEGMGNAAHFVCADTRIPTFTHPELGAVIPVRGFDVSATDGTFKPREADDVKIGATAYSDDNLALIVREGLDLADADNIKETTGITSVAVDSARAIRVLGNVATAEGALSVYTVSGVKVAAGNGSVDLSKLARGIYVIEANGKVIKVVR